MIDLLFPTGWAHYLAGGLLLGAGVALLFATTGLIGGMSTFFSASWSWVSRLPYFAQSRFVDSRGWRAVYALGVILGAALWHWGGGAADPMTTEVPAWQLLVGGMLVGFGARRANGCTSGHGICGLGSLQWPSALAVLTFMASAFVAANLVLAIGGGR